MRRCYGHRATREPGGARDPHSPVARKRENTVSPRTPFGPYARLFGHWRDRANAERMNHWLDVLLRNHRLLREAATDVLA